MKPAALLTLGWRWGVLLAVSLSLAWLLDRAAFPAALLLGPLTAAIGFGAGGVRMQVPRWTFVAAQAVVGCLVARAINAAILVSLARDWAAMLLIVVTTVVAGGIVGWVLVRFRVLPGTTAAWGSSPGGASAMIVMAEEFGADVRLVAFMQYLRVVVVTLTASLVSRLLIGVSPATAVPPPSVIAAPFAVPVVPLLETLAIAGGGALVGWRLRMPAGSLLVPMVVGAWLHVTGAVEIALPPWLLGVTYAVLGWYVGLGFNRDVIVYAFRAIPQLLLATLMLIGLCGVSAFILTVLLQTDPLTAYLATSPGGLDSVAIIALGSHANVPFVLAVQTLRVFVVIVTGAPIARLISRYA